MDLTHEELKVRLLALQKTMVAMAAEAAARPAPEAIRQEVLSESGHLQERVLLRAAHDRSRQVLRHVADVLDTLGSMLQIAVDARSRLCDGQFAEPGAEVAFEQRRASLLALTTDTRLDGQGLFDGSSSHLMLEAGALGPMALPLPDLMPVCQKLEAVGVDSVQGCQLSCKVLDDAITMVYTQLDEIEALSASLGKRVWSLGI